jgi:hypothetical protein
VPPRWLEYDILSTSIHLRQGHILEMSCWRATRGSWIPELPCQLSTVDSLTAFTGEIIHSLGDTRENELSLLFLFLNNKLLHLSHYTIRNSNI